MSDCIFCKIARHQIPSEVVYEDESFLAFKDINPAAPVHVLIIPKEHYGSLLEVPEEASALLGKALSLAGRLAASLGLAEKGFRLVINTGEEGGQSVPHLHLHILGGRSLQWPPG